LAHSIDIAKMAAGLYDLLAEAYDEAEATGDWSRVDEIREQIAEADAEYIAARDAEGWTKPEERERR